MTRSARWRRPRGPGTRGSGTAGRPRPRVASKAVPHTGHSFGNSHAFSPFFGRSDRTGPTTSGMTSPALRTMTVSPGRTSLAFTWSSLWSVATPTVEPPTNTGSSMAKGVARPVRPIDTMMSLQQRGAFLGRELVGDRPARRLAGQAERRAQREVVDLDHDAVDLVGEVVAVLLPVLAERVRRGEVVHHGDLGVDREAELARATPACRGGCVNGRGRPRPRRAGSSRTPAHGWR